MLRVETAIGLRRRKALNTGTSDYQITPLPEGGGLLIHDGMSHPCGVGGERQTLCKIYTAVYKLTPYDAAFD